MALQARHRYIIQRLDDAFGIGDEGLVEELFRADENKVLDVINVFFSPEGANRIFFMYQAPMLQRLRRGSKIGRSMMPSTFGSSSLIDGAADASLSSGNDLGKLLVSDGDSLRFEGKSVYFMKTRSPPEGAKTRSILVDASKSHDGLLVFGCLGPPLRSLETVLRVLYLPMLKAQDPQLWGRANPDHRQEFLTGLENFIQNLQDNLKSLSGGLELRRPDPQIEAAAGATTMLGGRGASPALAAHYLDVLKDWCLRIESYLDDSDRTRWETNDSGPDTELEYWRRRMQRLTSITEQLKTRQCKNVIGVLTSVSKLPDDTVVDRQQVFSEVRRWRQIDVQITEAANEAKDNVKYLATLERFMEPLYSGNLELILDILPGLMNAAKMIHTIARYFNTTERMTKLFMKITNQMINSAKLAINGRDLPVKIWDKDPELLLVKLEQILQLNEAYQNQYRLTKDKLLTMPKGKQFDFSETQIFGKFDLFCRRVIKLIDMYSTIQQFRCLRTHRLEGMETLLQTFDDVVREFKLKGHDLLDYHSNKFDRDYVQFNQSMMEMEGSLQSFINRSFENITSIEQSLALLKKYQSILHRENLKKDLESKFSVIFHNYGLELQIVSEIYENVKNSPPIPRNMPPVAGKIMWARHLLKRIEDPMRKFQGNPAVLRARESKKIIKQYNKVAQTLVAFEYTWFEAWCKSVENARAGLQATLIIKHPDTGALYVNFDPEIVQLIREAKCLSRLGIEIPEAARMVLLQEHKYKTYYNELKYALSEHQRVTQKIAPITAPLLKPHLQSLGLKLRPGLVTLTWTSMNIDAYKLDVHVGLQRLEELIAKINDLVENRIEKNLKVVSRSILVNLPSDTSVTLDEFVTMQEQATLESTEILVAKNQEVETAVEDLINIVKTFPIDKNVGPVPADEVVKLKEHYTNLMYRAVLQCTMSSLTRVKDRVCSRASHGFLFVERPFFEVDVQLSVPSVRLSPSLEDVQRAINRTATTLLGCAKRIWAWGQQHLADDAVKISVFPQLGQDLEIVKVCLLLTGALFGTKIQVHEYLQTFRKYDWLWKEDKEIAYRKFVVQNPTISDFEAELQKFMDVECEIEAIPPMHNIGAFTLNTANLKMQLRNESRQWKVQYSNKVHQQARESMYGLFEYIRVMTNKLSRDVDGLDSLRYVMHVLREIRDRESSIELEITPILDMYQILEVYLPGGVVDKEEMDQKSVIRQSWRKLVEYAESVTDTLSSIQGKYKKQLIVDVKEFIVDVRGFRSDFEKFGPMREGLAPLEAVERLRRYKDEFQLRERKMEIYKAGEELFALRPTLYPDLVKTKKELVLMDQLYGLYMDVLNSIESYRSVLWSDVQEHLSTMTDTIGGFENRCKKLPKKLKELEAYDELRKNITNFSDILPLLQELCKSSIKPRHWKEVIQITSTDYPYDKEMFKLQHLLDSHLLDFVEDVEEVCRGADKQLQIETKLADIKEQWARMSFEFSIWKGRGLPVLKTFGLVIEELEEAQLQLQSLLSMRHVTPFREDVQKKLTELSDTADTLELWVKVQMLWTSLESVFMGGDIAKQMPLEAKKFAKIDKDWAKIMTRASETQNVVACCSNELLRNTLPVLYAELEKCQKSLEGYLEQKRTKFPRFYFVSNPVLLLILSQGSDPMQMQPYYEKVYDSISRVVHDRADKTKITQIKSITGADEETINLDKEVSAVGNIEEWLGILTKQMQVSLKSLCDYAAGSCMTLPLRQFVNNNCGQFALLGLQFSWTHACQDALEKCKLSKGIMHETNKQQLQILQDLSAWCLEDVGTKMNRTKIETLVTIQVHQRDVFLELWQRYKERKLSDSNDFEWLKQARFFWKPNVEDQHGNGACIISICDVDFKYCFEYLGCKERLVVTPLTDRCYITLSQALGMYLGGAPAGPAGTGKTETTKDLGRSLGIFVVVTNCTDQQRHTDMAKIFKGLCQAGLWGCFDEFNRIELPVLSVVAQQVLAITNAKRVGSRTVQFPGDSQVITLNRDVGYFITMNPGYQGRQELPENLKVLFRSVAMMVPDREIIMKVKLCSVGYQQFPELARKFNVLYRLCEQQLSKQKHYDFGLRNILSVLRTAGKTKRDYAAAHPGESSEAEDMLLYRTLRDMNLSKLVAQDVPLFLMLLTDLFPSVGLQNRPDHPEMSKAIEETIVKDHLISHSSWNLKIMQLYETTLVRHGIMLVGPSGSGKSTIIKVLQDSLSKVTKLGHKRISMNPKAIRAEEMFGETDKLSGEWLDGIFAAIWSKYNDRTRKDVQWIICDGPVDAIWIENLNTVLDDNKILTLANGDRIAMTDNVKLMFENEDLRNASPATVSRAGIIYVSDTDLDWEPVAKAWLNKQEEPSGPVLTQMLRKYLGECKGPKAVGHLFQFIQKNLSPVCAVSRVALIESMLELLTGLLKTIELSQSVSDLEAELDRIFLFSIAWSIGGLLEFPDQQKFDEYLRNLSRSMPPKERPLDVIYDFFVNNESCEWERWICKDWQYPSRSKNIDFGSLLIPTIDSVRATYIMQHMHQLKKPTLLVGGSGTGKTTASLMFFEHFASGEMLVKKIYFSSATTPGMFQSAVEGELDKRGGKNFGPPSGKRMTFFLDDLSMPEINDWGDQPTLEIVRQLVETGGFCFLDKDKRGDLKNIEDIQYLAAMNHPSGGKNDIPNRLKRHFFIFNLILPPEDSINNIYGQMLSGRFPSKDHSLNFYRKVISLPKNTIQLWKWVRNHMLPSPSKFHYIFNMRELSRIFSGILKTPKESVPNEIALLRLWRHECKRVFADKLTTLEDKEVFQKELDSVTCAMMEDFSAGDSRSLPSRNIEKKGSVDSNLSPKEQALEDAYFVDFLREDEYDDDGALVQLAPKLYEDGGSLEFLQERVKGFLQKYNEDIPSMKMDLVLFDDALKHLMRISRLLGMPRGNMLLVGVGGSGKRSLTRLASHIARNHTFQITITKAYNLNALMDDLRAIYKRAGQQGDNVTFIFTEAEIKDETFLEVINSILMSGEVTNLFPKDELALMAAELRPFALKEIHGFQDTPENLVRYFIDRVRRNLHVTLCMSPVNPKFAERARKFPGLINGCTIDWFLTWPPEALVAVSKEYIDNMALESTPQVRGNIVKHMGMVHRLVVESCEEYFSKMRRHVYQTPKSFLSFLEQYRVLYGEKLSEVKQKQKRVHVGLENLRKGAEDVERMKILLKQEEVKLKKAEESTNAMLSRLEVSSMEAKKESDAVSIIKERCERDATTIAGEKSEAEADLAQAQPFVEEAERAVESIKGNDLNELKKLPKPSDIIKLIFDCVGILKFEKLQRVEQAEVTLGIGKDKKTFIFIKDSWGMIKAGMLSDARFLQNIFAFSKYEKDFINDETVELMMPYLELPGFNPAVARNASKAAEGLCTWTRAMMYYHEASKVVKPKLEALRVAEARLSAALRELDKAEAKKKACQDVQAKLQADFEGQMAQKRQIEENAAATRKRMETATALIDGLAGERQRWTEDSNSFDEMKQRLVGDVAVACAFVSYCGPFNQDFRNYLVMEKFTSDLKQRYIPVTPNQDLVAFFVDIGTIGDWNLEGLPTDSLSIQNGLLVTRSSRYPLLVDPQGQALTWIKNHEAARLPVNGVTSLSAPKLREHVEFAMAEGKALIISGVEQELDPLLNPILEKQIIVKARTKYITVADKLCEFNDEFQMYMVTRLPNPHFSPEDQAKTTMIDFTVTQKGLEEQLLGIVIQKEQRSLEEQLNNVIEEVTANTKSLLSLDQQLLERLSSHDGNLLDDTELINVLAATKAKANEVNEKLIAAAEMRVGINEKREQYRPVATRGSVLYFSIVDMSLVNCMYQTSLDQFQIIFDKAMENAEKAQLASKRVNNIIETLTYSAYCYVTRGIYERDKLSFKLIIAVKILITANHLKVDEMALFLKGGAALDAKLVRPKPLMWLTQPAWMNVVQLSQEIHFFHDLPEEMVRNEPNWVAWYAENEPESQNIPYYEQKFQGANAGFLRLLLVRMLREDRTLLCVNQFIEGLEFIEVAGSKLPALGSRYVEPLTETVDSIYKEMNAHTPVIYLLSAGADPTDSIENLSRKKRVEMMCVSMGEGQEPVAIKAINTCAVNGGWVLLQNCHLGLIFMDTMEELLMRLKETVNEDFRLFITSEPHPQFPIGLLQMCTKVTNEPPKGLRAGLLRSFNVLVDQDKLERVETMQWRSLLYTICFLHSIVQERRKFGPLGWCIPYEYNDGDLNACITFLEKHLYSGAISWPTLQYMVGECQYGGKITDDLDRRLFKTYAEAWLSPSTLAPSFTFNPEAPLMRIPNDFRYAVPDCQEVDEYKAFVQSFPTVDSPEVFGLHPNADLTFRNQEVNQLLRTITETQPKQGGGGSGRSKEDIVKDKCQELLRMMPTDYIEDTYLAKINQMGGLEQPLNIFLMQEIQRLQMVIDKVRNMLVVILQAIQGEVVVTADLMDAINSIFDARVPKPWMYSSGGDEISWISPTLGLWFSGLTQRNEQNSSWLDKVPACFWLTGFFNPQGFLTAVQQEVTRAHKADSWSLDSVVLHTEVTEFERVDQVRVPAREGVFIHGLYIDGACWSRSDNTLVESEPKKLFFLLPVLFVTAVTKIHKKNMSGDYGPYGGYECPVYKYPCRNDQYLVFMVTLASRDHRPSHWILRGTALLCCID